MSLRSVSSASECAEERLLNTFFFSRTIYSNVISRIQENKTGRSEVTSEAKSRACPTSEKVKRPAGGRRAGGWFPTGVRDHFQEVTVQVDVDRTCGACSAALSQRVI